MITTTVSTIFFYLFSGSVEKTLNASGLFSLILLFPLAIISNSVAYILGSWVSRKEEFGTLALGNICSSITGKAVSIGSGIISPSPAGLILGTIVNDATIAVVLLKKTLTYIHFFKSTSFRKIKKVALRYKKFPQYNAGANLASTAVGQSTPILLAFYFSPAVVGLYAMAHMIIFLPSRLMGNSIATVFFQKASVEKNLTGSIKNIVKKVHTRLVSIGMFICLIIMIIGPELFSFFLGAQWSVAGVYAQILAPWFFISFISTPLFSIFAVMEKQGASLWFNILLLISNVSVLVISGRLGDPILSMLLLSVTGVIFWTWMNMFLLKLASVSVHDAMGEIFRYLVFGVLVCMPLIIAKYFTVSMIPLLSIAVVVTIIYYSVVIHQDAQLKEGLLQLLGSVIHTRK
jgi:O-antigen/teichoic acid export membrane protein